MTKILLSPADCPPWLTAWPVQGEVWLKMEQETDIYTVVAQLKVRAREGGAAL